MEEANAFLRQGVLLFYPTETYYALGCGVSATSSINNIFEIKKRPHDKNLPIIAGSFEQAAGLCDLSLLPDKLKNYWPGPLTALLPSRRPLHPALCDASGRVAIRISSSSVACQLALLQAEPLISTSANLSGRPPVRLAENMDEELLDRIQSLAIPVCFLKKAISGASGMPSTIVEIISTRGVKSVLRILREGAITREMLLADDMELIN